jgi:predicted dehydrogenase
METIRVGIIGAGTNTKLRHIPELQKIKGVVVSAVCNRSEKSSSEVAREFGIKRVFSNWQELVEDENIDAIMIGTWPNMHEIISTAALLAGKHVLCEARMSMNASEAHEMLRTSRCFPHLIAQVVPAPFTFPFDKQIIEMINDNFLGDILAVNVRFNSSTFISRLQDMTWRENIELSGLNTLMMGIVYESLARWIGHAKSVQAQSVIFSGLKTWEGELKAVEVPEHLNILADMHCGAKANMQFSSATGLAEQHQEIWLFGSEGTIHLDFAKGVLRAGQRDQEKLEKITPLTDKTSKWRVEEEFIGAIRGEEKIKFTSFAEGVRYMEFTEAVARSCRSGKTVSLPLNLNN